MADSAIARWPEGKITRGDEKLSDWAYNKSVLFTGLVELWQRTRDQALQAEIEIFLDRLGFQFRF